MLSSKATPRYGIILILWLAILLMNFTSVLARFQRLGGVGGGVSWRYEVVVCEDGVRFEVAANLTPAEIASSFAGVIATQGGSTVAAQTGITLQIQPTPVFEEEVDLGGDGTIDQVAAYAWAAVYVPYTNPVNPAAAVTVQVTSTQGGSSTGSYTVRGCSINNPNSMPPLNFNQQSAFDRFGFNPRDGRTNLDAHATAAIYCQDDGAIHVYAITSSSTGELAFVVTPAEIAAVGIPTTNTVLARGSSPFGGELVLYRLTSGEFQLSGPALPPETAKGYTFIWDGCEA